ncbi:MAG: acyltransferase family protein [Methanobacterium sp.]|uniref:acyltransferase family protein n=1 Tax=Methanobacterium sp. TaxID=2164 RepID=UPI003D649D8F|nr:acyltransferase family protein [Methanobacterium sp.]
MTENNLSKHYLQIDLLKAIAIILVIIIHSINGPRFNLGYVIPITIFYLTATFTLNMAVPIFFILMGRNTGASFKRKGYKTLKSIFTLFYFKKKFIRIIFPLILISLVSIILGILLKENLYFGILTFLGRMPFEGVGTGWGNYFVSILIQFIFVFPFLYLLYGKSPKLMLIVAFLINFAFEIIATFFPVFQGNSYEYRASIFRYLFMIALGLWIMDKMDDISIIDFFSKYKWIAIGVILSFVYLVMRSVYNWYVPYFLPSWQSVNMFSAFYPLIICILGFIYLPSESSNKIINFIGTIGKASYHIFLVQIIYFASGFTIISFIIPPNLYVTYSLFTIILLIVGDLIFCFSLGLIFFYLESKLANRIMHLQFINIIYNIYKKITKNWIKHG